MYSEIPISIISNSDQHIFHFDVAHINDPNKIEFACIKVKKNTCPDSGSEISVSVNNNLSDEDTRFLQENKRIITESDNGYRILADVSEAVKMIASGNVENKGIILGNIKCFCNPRLILYYQQEIICPPHNCAFFEKELQLLSFANRVESPWFASALADTITFFVYNKGTEDITIHLENSPNTIINVEDAQRILVPVGQTVNIVPSKFSKFVRLIVDSGNGKIACEVWFQAQLRG